MTPDSELKGMIDQVVEIGDVYTTTCIVYLVIYLSYVLGVIEAVFEVNLSANFSHTQAVALFYFMNLFLVQFYISDGSLLDD